MKPSSQRRSRRGDGCIPPFRSRQPLAPCPSVLVFDIDERGPDDDLRLPFEAAAQLDPDEKRLVRELIEGLVLKREVRRWAAKG